jgi:hypothetical protein
MTDQDYRMTIARDWMEKSEAAFRDAEILFRSNSPVGCVNFCKPAH